MATWQEMLREARRAAGLSQEELAQRVGASPKTVERLESGTSAPPRRRLLAICRALGLDHDSTDTLLRAAGLDPLTAYPASSRRPLGELRRLLSRLDFPALAHNARVEIIVWNDAANRVAELDFGRDRPNLQQRSLFRIAVDKHFLARIENWAEILRLLVQNFKTLEYDILDPTKDPMYFQALVADLMQSDRFVDLMTLWQLTQKETLVVRGYFPARWRVRGDQILSFHCTHTGMDLFNAIGLIAWYPADAATWDWLRATAPVPTNAATKTDATDGADIGDDNDADDAGESAGRLLRWARDSTGLTQKQLAEKTGITAGMLTLLEHDKRHLTAEFVERAVMALQMDPALANELRLRAGLDPVASDWTPGVIERGTRGLYFRYEPDRLHNLLQSTRAWLHDHIPERPYPCLSLDETATLLCWNDLLAAALPEPLRAGLRQDANFVDWLLAPASRAAIGDWETAALELLNSLLHHAPGYPQPRCDLPRIVRRLDLLAAADPALHPLLHALTARLSLPASMEWWPIPIALRADDGTPLRYIAALNTWNDYDTLWCLELHPADGTTWDWLNSRAGG